MNNVTIELDLLPCPFCGDKPELPSGEGTQYEIECRGCGQAIASVQICDLMSPEERAADSFTNYRYANEFVERAKKQALENWNTRAAPRQPEGEGLEVVAWQDAENPLYTTAERRVLHDWANNGYPIVELCRLSDHLRAIAELREECERLRGECARLESKYERDVWGLNNEGDPIGGDPAGGFANDLFRVTTERDTLRQQLAERDAEVLEQCRLNGMGTERELKLMTQRDKLAGLLREGVNAGCYRALSASEMQLIDAALAEVEK